jgi:hypothetical protein
MTLIVVVHSELLDHPSELPPWLILSWIRGSCQYQSRLDDFHSWWIEQSFRHRLLTISMQTYERVGIGEWSKVPNSSWLPHGLLVNLHQMDEIERWKNSEYTQNSEMDWWRWQWTRRLLCDDGPPTRFDKPIQEAA